MRNVVTGIFTREDADRAISGLKSLGYRDDEISVIVRNKEESERIHEETHVEADVVEGAGQGAVTGGIVGALAGLLIGAGVVVLPPLGISLAGPIAAALGVSGVAASTIAGAGTGVVAGSLVGALTNLGLSDEDARTYERMITEDRGVLLAVEARDENASEVEDVFVSNNAKEVRTRLGSST